VTGELAQDFGALTALGGRLAGSRSESEALAFLRARVASVKGAQVREHRFDYRAWASRETQLTADGIDLRCHALVWSGECVGLDAAVVDLGRGSEDDFARERVAGKVALVRHEYPFASDTIHRRVKYARARDSGAAAFVIANNLPGELLVTGSCGQDAPANIPGFGVTLEGARRLAAARRVRLLHANERRAASGINLIAELPGRQPEWVVACAHYDGHDLAQSALDNATGVAGCLEVLRRLAPAAPYRYGLRVVFFTAEESGLLGSRRYVESLSESERRSIAMVVNLDTIAGSERLAALTSGFAQTEALASRFPLRRVSGVLRNSDHFNFAQAGIPALRLVAGFDEPECDVRFLLTEGDRAALVPAASLARGADMGAALVEAALT
jgi:aminopeptidase YwaD